MQTEIKKGVKRKVKKRGKEGNKKQRRKAKKEMSGGGKKVRTGDKRLGSRNQFYMKDIKSNQRCQLGNLVYISASESKTYSMSFIPHSNFTLGSTC